MIVSKLSLRNFRNYSFLDVAFDPKMNILIGDNAQGKTNIVEAIHFLSLARSFRTFEEIELIRTGSDFASIQVEVCDSLGRKNISSVINANEKKMFLNGKLVRRFNEISKLINVITFQPKDSLMFNDSPQIRRDFLDINISKLSNTYLDALIRHKKILEERNKLLKQDNVDLIQLEIYTDQLIECSETIVRFRVMYVAELNRVINKIIHSIKGGEENARIIYNPYVKFDAKFNLRAHALYTRAQAGDVKGKITHNGIHREDFSLEINEKDIASYGSQGENRLSVIALKIAPYFLIEDEDKKPIIVLDDVLSELDNNHQERLLNFLKTKVGQVFITSTKTNYNLASIYEVKDQNVKRRNA